MKELTPKQWFTIGILVCVIAFGGGFITGKNSIDKSPDTLIPQLESSIMENEPALLKVYVTGAVKNPDVYDIKEGSIVKDAIEIAGGPTESADLVAINLARRISDGEEIIVPEKREESPLQEEGGGTQGHKINGKLNINMATVEELMELPGIGEVKANAIVNYRKENGPFKNIHDIVKVSGIGEKTFESLKELICVN